MILPSLLPIALGHMTSIGIVVAVFRLAQASLPLQALQITLAGVLILFGLYHLIRFRHPTWVGMRVGFRDLTLWSFVMASAHGAGLMLLPLLLGWPEASHAAHAHLQISASEVQAAQAMQSFVGLNELLLWLAVVGVHATGHLLVSALIAFLVYEKLGLAMLRRAWFNLDLLWVITILTSGILILLV